MVFLSPNSICLPSHLNTLARLVFQNHHIDLITPYSETTSSTSTLFESKLTKILYLTLNVLHADPIQSHLLVLHNTDLPNFQVRAVYLQYIHQGFFYRILYLSLPIPQKGENTSCTQFHLLCEASVDLPLLTLLYLR